MKLICFVLLTASLTGCSNPYRFKRAGINDKILERIAVTAIKQEQITARAALGYTDGNVSPNPFKHIDSKQPKKSNELNELLKDIPYELAGIEVNEDIRRMSLFSGPIINSTIQINTGAASKQTKGGSKKEHTLGAIAQAAVDKIGTPVKTDWEIGIDKGMGMLKTIAYPLAGAYVLKEGFRAAGDNSRLENSLNTDNSSNDVTKITEYGE